MNKQLLAHFKRKAFRLSKGNLYLEDETFYGFIFGYIRFRFHKVKRWLPINDAIRLWCHYIGHYYKSNAVKKIKQEADTKSTLRHIYKQDRKDNINSQTQFPHAELNIYCRELLARLDNIERTLIIMLADGYNITEIAQELKYSRVWIYKMIEELKEKLTSFV